MKRIDVAIAVVYRGERVLICRRRAQDHLGGFWELPGGKVEAEESLEQCLTRELLEELAIEVEILTPLAAIEHDYPDRQVRLHPFLCAHKDGEPTPLGCAEARWVHGSSLREYQFPPANAPLIESVMRFLADRQPSA